jgi:uncharacterized RDD family membrane protein YckC
MIAGWTLIVVTWRYIVYHRLHGSTELKLHFSLESEGNLLFLFVYFAIACFVGNGKTPGKSIARTRVVSLTHQKIGLWQSTERALGYGASLLELGFGFFQFFINRNRQTVHDRIAETIVIDTRKRPV